MGMGQRPLSVILPVYNGAKTIERAVASILSQSFEDFELIIINDGSTDGTESVLSGIADRRIRMLEQENQGLAFSLNRGIQESSGEFIARMDADDESYPDRFAKQMRFLKAHPEVAIVGSHVLQVYPDGSERLRKRPITHEALLRNIVRICPFAHSSIMGRKAAFKAVGGYDLEKDGATRLLVEDYDLWVRMLAAGFRFANMDEPLLRYYVQHDSIFRKRSLRRRLWQQIQSRREIITTLGLPRISYLNIVPVTLVSILDYLGVKVDSIFNILGFMNRIISKE